MSKKKHKQTRHEHMHPGSEAIDDLGASPAPIESTSLLDPKSSPEYDLQSYLVVPDFDGPASMDQDPALSPLGRTGHAVGTLVADPPQVQVRDEPAPEEVAPSPGEAPLGRPQPGIRPVKARVGTGNLTAEWDGAGNGSGLATVHLTTRRLANGNGSSDRLNPEMAILAAPASTSTGHLREMDLEKARLRLKTEKLASGLKPTRPLGVPLPAPSRSRTIHQRPLPFFLMRHRTVRITSRVGHTRAQASVRRLGKGGFGVTAVRIFVVLFLISTLASFGAIGGGIAGAGWYLGSLPPVDPEHLASSMAANGITVQTTRIFDRNGVPLYDIEDEQTGRREELPLAEISPLVISATVATEDASFYTNLGVDPYAILRAVYITTSGKGESGASTITQQLARLVLLSPEERQVRTGLEGMNRKIREAVLAIEMSRTYSKDQILEMYLNQIPYGHRAYGIGAAARTYFNKSAKDLTLAEAALLAGLPQSPSRYDPFVNPQLAKARQAIVLDLMAKQGYVTQQQADDAKSQNVYLRPYTPPFQAPHFVYYVKEYLEAKYGTDFADAGLNVYTTLDLKLQNAAQQVAKDRIAQIRQQQASNASIVVLNPHTGEILAMVGSVDYYDTTIDGQVNMATSPRQPGSSFKPITYATAFTKGWSPATTILDVATAFPNGNLKPYTPHNYDSRDHGWVTVREALAQSLNIPAVKAIQFAGLQDTIDMAHAMGIKGLNRDLSWYGLSLTLGGGEVSLLDMANAYGTFANYGMEVDANPILKITDSQGRVIEQLNPDPAGKQVLDPRIAYQITSVLSDNRARTPAFGPSSPLLTSFPSAVKTGTTDSNRDSWTLGYTPNLVVGVWVGNTDNAEMQSITGAIGAAVIWNKMMSVFYDSDAYTNLVRPRNSDGSAGTLQRDFVQPSGLVRLSACSAKGYVTDLFLSDQRPTGCVTYKDPKGNVQLHTLPQPTARPKTTPGQPTPAPAKPTPMPGILPPSFP